MNNLNSNWDDLNQGRLSQKGDGEVQGGGDRNGFPSVGTLNVMYDHCALNTRWVNTLR
jgi:hypothetical protein